MKPVFPSVAVMAIIPFIISILIGVAIAGSEENTTNTNSTLDTETGREDNASEILNSLSEAFLPAGDNEADMSSITHMGIQALDNEEDASHENENEYSNEVEDTDDNEVPSEDQFAESIDEDLDTPNNKLGPQLEHNIAKRPIGFDACFQPETSHTAMACLINLLKTKKLVSGKESGESSSEELIGTRTTEIPTLDFVVFGQNPSPMPKEWSNKIMYAQDMPEESSSYEVEPDQPIAPESDTDLQWVNEPEDSSEFSSFPVQRYYQIRKFLDNYIRAVRPRPAQNSRTFFRRTFSLYINKNPFVFPIDESTVNQVKEEVTPAPKNDADHNENLGDGNTERKMICFDIRSVLFVLSIICSFVVGRIYQNFNTKQKQVILTRVTKGCC